MAKETKNKKENNRHFFKDFKAELKKVIWPTPKQVVNNTTAVITIVLLTAIIVFVLDLAFEKINTHGVDRLRKVVSQNENTVLDNSINEEQADEENEDETSEEDTTQKEDNTVSE